MKAVLVIGGSDCSSGAGIQRDLKVLQEKNVYGVSVITAITAQNVNRFYSFQPVALKIVRQQLEAVFEEFDIKFVKIGMIGSSRIVKLVSKFLQTKNVTIVYDPVLKSTTGGELTDSYFIDSIKDYLFPLVELLTPNVKETETLTNCKISQWNEEHLRLIYNEFRVKNLLIKGGHLQGKLSTDYLITEKSIFEFGKDRIPKEVRGTGCSYASSIVCELYKGKSLKNAVQDSKDWLWKKIEESEYKNFL